MEETSLSYLPYDTRVLILESEHPYYIQNYCKTTQELNEICQNNIYPLLKKWCYPDSSIEEIRQVIHNATMDNVVYLSLAYSPIPESTKYWDRVTLVYNACSHNYDLKGIIPLIGHIMNDNGAHFHPIPWICYKFGRLDIMDYLIDIQMNFASEHDISYLHRYHCFVSVKLGKKMEKDYKYSINDRGDGLTNNATMKLLSDMILTTMGGMLDYEDIIELIIVAYIAITEDPGMQESPIVGIYQKLLNGPTPEEIQNLDHVDTEDYVGLINKFVLYAAHECGNEQIRALLDYHGLDEDINFDYSTLDMQNQGLQQVSRHIDVDISNIPEEYRWVYYLTSSDFGTYLPSEKPDENPYLLSDLQSFTRIGMYAPVSFNSYMLDPEIAKGRIELDELTSSHYAYIYASLGLFFALE